MTKEVGYRRKMSASLQVIQLYYHKYPEFVKTMIRRHVSYNRTLDFLEEHEKKGHIFIIRPQKATGIGRIEKDRSKLEKLYEMGYEEAKQCGESLMEYLNS